MAQHFFVKTSLPKSASGPLSVSQLSQLANEGKLLASSLVSTDKQAWFPAADLNWLSFQPAVAEPTPSSGKPLEFEFELEPIQESPIAKSQPVAAQQHPAAASEPELEFELEPLEEPNQPEGVRQAVDLKTAAKLEMAAELDYELQAIPAPSVPPTQPAASHQLSHAAGRLHSEIMLAPTSTAPASIRVPNPRATSMSAMVIGLLLLLFNFIWFFVAVIAEDNKDPSATPAFFLIGMVLSVITIFLIPALSTTSISVTSGGQGRVNCVVKSCFLNIPYRTTETVVTQSDQLILNVRSVAASEKEGEVMQYTAMALCFLFGIIPGLLFYYYWVHLRTYDTSSAIVRLILYTQHYEGRPIILFTRKVKDYYGTRLGAPAEVDKIKNMFQKMVLIPVITDEL